MIHTSIKYRVSKQNFAPEMESPSVRPVRPVLPVIPYTVHILLTDSVQGQFLFQGVVRGVGA